MDFREDQQNLDRTSALMALGLFGLGVLIALQFAGLTWYSAAELDQREIEQSKLRVQAALKREKDVLAAVSSEYGWWTELINAIEARSLSWLADEFDASLYTKYRISEVIVLDEANSPLYAQVRSVQVTDNMMLGWDLADLQALIHAAQASPMDLPQPSASTQHKSGKPYIVTAAALTHSDRDAPAEQRPRKTLIMAAELDEAFLQQESENVQVNDLAWSPQYPSTDGVISVTSISGEAQGYLGWNTEKTGMILVSNIMLWSMPVAILAVLAGVVLLLWFQALIKYSRDAEIGAEVARQSQDYFQSMSDDAPVMIWQADMNGKIIYANRQCKALFESLRPGQRPAELSDVRLEGDGSGLMGLLADIKKSKGRCEGEYALLASGENPLWLYIIGIPQRSSTAEFDFILFSANDITSRKQAELAAWNSANFDSLTNLPNRSLLQERLSHELALAKRSNAEAGLMFIDLDNFKVINDSLGHQAGDEVLQVAAARIAGCLRECDTAARFGGDEFVILLPNAPDAAGINEVARRIRSELSKTMSIAGTVMHITASIGVAYYPRDGKGGETLMERADTAMYYAKKNGRDDIAFYDSSMIVDVNSRR